MYMDDIKDFAKHKKELETFIQTVRIYNQDIEMEFGIEKWAMLVMKTGKHHMMEGVELPKKKNQNSRRKGNLQILGNIGSWHHQTNGDERKKLKKSISEKNRKLLETKLYCRNLIQGINTWAVHLVRYSGPFLQWTREELKQMDQTTRKLLTIHKALYPRADVDRLYVSKKEGWRGLASIKDSVDLSIQRLEDYREKHGGRLITATLSNNEDTRISRTTITRKQK